MCEKRQINAPQVPFNKTPPMCKVMRMRHQQTVEVSNFENQQQQQQQQIMMVTDGKQTAENSFRI